MIYSGNAFHHSPLFTHLVEVQVLAFRSSRKAFTLKIPLREGYKQSAFYLK